LRIFGSGDIHDSVAETSCAVIELYHDVTDVRSFASNFTDRLDNLSDRRDVLDARRVRDTLLAE
jgi:hypothetical protein